MANPSAKTDAIIGYISAFIGSLWIGYLNNIKKPIFGLSPLQEYILTHHKPEHGNPLLTYFYFLTYEKEVWERKCDAEEANQEKEELDRIYAESVKAVKFDRSVENTRIKMIMHMISLVFIVSLMLSASAVSTGKIMGLWGEAFGPYAYLAQAFFYVTAAGAQWMIYRKTVPEVLKKLYFGKDGFHFAKHRVLKISGEKLENTVTDQPKYSKTGLFLFTICSIFLAISLGMIVLDTAGGSVDDGNVFKSMAGINALAQGFGGVNGMGWFLCIASILCNFALFVSGSLKFLFERATQDGADKKPGWSKTKIGAIVALFVFSTFGLITTVMAQSKSTLDFLWSKHTDELEMPGDSHLGLLLIPILTIVASAGRIIFNFKAMENLQTIFSEVIAHRRDLWNELVQDHKDNKWTYALGYACVASVLTVFGMMGGFGGDTGISALHPSNSALGIIPFVATLGGAIAVFSLFKFAANVSKNELHDENANNSIGGSPESSPKPKPIPMPVKNTFTLQRDSERRSGLQILMIAGNVVGAGGISASSVATLLLYGNEGNKDLKLALVVLSMFAGGLMSMASALNRVNVKVTPPSTSLRM